MYNVSGKGDPIWYFNTEQHGLLKYDANKNMFVDHTLESSNVYGQALYMSPIVDDQMWILHNNYLINHHLTSSAMRVFGPEDGMPEEAFEMNFIRYEPADKLFYLASFNHLLTFSALNYDKRFLSLSFLKKTKIFLMSLNLFTVLITKLRPAFGITVKFQF